MKIIFAIINNDDAPIVANQLTRAGINVTKMASTGGFLMRGNSTFISGVEDERVDEAIEIIKKYSQRRSQVPSIDYNYAQDKTGIPAQIIVGGATIFVVDVERYERA
jgi:uncharacterized protein YaaQ